MSTEAELKKSKKKSSKTKEATAKPSEAEGAGEESKENKKEKSKKRKVVEEIVESESSTKAIGESEKPKKAKKEKKEKKKEVMVVQAAPPSEPETSSSGLPSSTEIVADTSLSSSAQQALLYARQYALHSASPKSDPPIWKFNKAKQNWLLKHIWDVNEVPEKYTELVFGYVATVQGGRRRDVQDKAQELSLRSTTTAPATDSEAADGEKEDEEGGESSADAAEVKRRAVRMLELLQAQL